MEPLTSTEKLHNRYIMKRKAGLNVNISNTSQARIRRSDKVVFSFRSSLRFWIKLWIACYVLLLIAVIQAHEDSDPQVISY